MLEAIVEKLDALLDPLVVRGTLPARAITARLPTGEALALDAANVEPLLPHCEPAPFGRGGETKVDRAVRDALRLKARDAVELAGLDVKPLLAAIEAAISPAERLRAKLTDVIVTPPGGHFALHKDTPKEAGMVGTLLVWLPAHHTGGGLRLFDGGRDETVELERDALTWAAFAGDVPHEVRPVEHGHRVTLAFRLGLAGVTRSEPRPEIDALADAIAALYRERSFLPDGGRLAIPCARQAIVAAKTTQLAPRDVRGSDRLLTDALAARGLVVHVRPYLALVDPDRLSKSSEVRGEVLLHADEVVATRRPLSAADARSWEECVSADDAYSFDEGEGHATSIAGLVDHAVPLLLRRAPVAAAFLHEATYSATGYFGNEAHDAHFYTFAAIELEVPNLDARGLGAPAPPKRRVVHAKFGEGEVLAEDQSRGEPVLEIRFASGETKKLLARFVKDA